MEEDLEKIAHEMDFRENQNRLLRNSDQKKKLEKLKRKSLRTQPSLLYTMNYSSSWIGSIL